jgi:hypothetical protein
MKVSDIIYTVCFLHVVATCMAILSEVHYKRYITKVVGPVQKCKILSFRKICSYDLKQIL